MRSMEALAVAHAAPEPSSDKHFGIDSLKP